MRRRRRQSNTPAGGTGRGPLVAHIHEPTSGGVPAFIYALEAAQREHGYRTIVVRTGAGQGERRTWAFIQNLLRARKQILRHSPDIVHLHSSYAGLMRLFNVPCDALVFQPHAWAGYRAPTALGRALHLTLERILARRTDCVLTLSCDESAYARKAHHKRVVQVTQLLTKSPSRIAPPEPTPTYCIIGRLCEQKGQLSFLRSCLRNLDENERVLLVGDGPDRAEVAKMARNDGRVEVRGHHPDPFSVVPANAVILLPSRWEGFPLVALEALAAGFPLVGFQRAELAQLDLPAGTVQILPDGDYHGLLVEARRMFDAPRFGPGAAFWDAHSPSAVASRVAEAYGRPAGSI